MLLGEHRRHNKQVPYEESVRVPMVVRYDPLTTWPRATPRLVLNVDFAPTFAQIAGVDAPNVEGRNMLPVLAARGPWRTDFLIEHWDDPGGVPTYCGGHAERTSTPTT